MTAPGSRRRSRTFTVEDSPADLVAEVERLTASLRAANAGFEDFERRYLMASHALEDIQDARDNTPAHLSVPGQVRVVLAEYDQNTAGDRPARA